MSCSPFYIEMGKAFFKEKEEDEKEIEKSQREKWKEGERERKSPKKRNDTILIMDDSGDG